MSTVIAKHVDFNILFEDFETLQPFFKCVNRSGHRLAPGRMDSKGGRHRRYCRIISLAAIRRRPYLDNQECAKFTRKQLDDSMH
ncbi:MAG: hypothetical protein H8E53_09415 [Planctomycetes bacterium]|nr:hypothetical protein [Planctomycetota bacterium]